MSGLVFGQTKAPTSSVTVDANGKVKGPKITDFTTGSTDLRVDGVNVVGGGGGGGGGSIPGGTSGDYQVNNAGVLDGNVNLRLEAGQVKAVAPNFIFRDGSDATKQLKFTLTGLSTGVLATVVVPDDPSPVLVSSDSGSTDLFMTGIDPTGRIFFGNVDFGALTGSLAFSQTSMTNNKLLGRAASGNGPIQNINIGTNLSLDTATQTLNATGGTSGITTIPIAASIYVDAVNGSSGGLRGRLDRPFQTISQAIAVALSGDVIYVGPGTFTENTGFTIPAGVSMVGAGGSNTLITSNLSDTTHAVMRWGTNAMASDLTVQCTGANSAPVGILTADTAATGALFIGVNTIGLIDGFKISKTGTNSFTALNCTTTSGTSNGTIDGLNSASGTNTINVENCEFNSTGTGTGLSSPRGIVVGSGTVKVWNSRINIASAGSGSGDNLGVRVTGGTAEIHGLIINRDGTGAGIIADLQQTGGTLNKENVSRPDGAALSTTGVIGELSRYASRDKNLSDLSNTAVSATNLLGGPGKGNLKVGDGSTWNTLVVGPDTQVLTADSTQTTGVKWGTGGGGGSAATKQDVGDADATISGDVTVINLTTPLTANRIITLPAASTYSTLLPLVIEDPRATTTSFTISLHRVGSDTINGAAGNAVVLGPSEAGGSVMIMSDGVNKWTTITKGGGSRIAGYIDGTSPTLSNVLKGTGTKFDSAPLTGAELALADVTTNNASTSNHGFLKKLDGNSTHFMDGTGNWTTPAGAGIGTVTSVGLAGTANQITITGTSPITSSGTWTASVPTAAQLNVAKLTNLTTNGFVKTGSSDGTLSTDTATYLTSASVTGTGFPHVTSGTLDGAAVGETGSGNVVRVVPGLSGNLLTSNGTVWTSAAPPASGVSSITGTSPIVVTPTTGAAVASLDTSVDAAWTVPQTISVGNVLTGQTITMNDAVNNDATPQLTLAHNYNGGAATTAMGAEILFQAEDSSNLAQNQVTIESGWTDATHASRTANLDFRLTNNAVGFTTVKMRIFGSGALSVGSGATVDPGAGYINALTGFKVNGTALAASDIGAQPADSDLTAFAAKTAPSGAVVGDTDAQTLTNKRISPRTHSTTSATSWTPDSDAYDVEIQTALAGACTINAPSGTPTVGQKLILRIKDNATAQTLSFATGSSGQYRFSTDMVAPTTTVLSKTMYVGFIWNATDSRWDNIAQANNF